MKCEDCQELLVEHLHRELGTRQRCAVTTHLGECGECATACCRLQTELDDIALALTEAPRPAVREALRARVEREFSPPWWKQAFAVLAHPVPAYGAVALAMLPLIIWGSPIDLLATESSSAQTPNAEARIKNYDASTALGMSTVIF